MAYNLIGKRFGLLLVISKTKLENKRGTYWECECDCTSKCFISTNKLVSGIKTNCGCKNQRKAINDLEGKIFGKLTVIKESKNEKGKKVWLCKCECGNTHTASGSDLTSGHTRSCGCLRKESKVGYQIFDEYVIGTTFNGDTFSISIQDYELIKHCNWFTDKDGYFVTSVNNVRTSMTHMILNPSKSEVIDHIDHDVSNNRRENLRVCSLSENAMNRATPSHNTSGKKGVSFNKKEEKWCAYIGSGGRQINLGLFNSFEEAVIKRKIAEDEYHGDYKYD
jgi:hypothetical protein